MKRNLRRLEELTRGWRTQFLVVVAILLVVSLIGTGFAFSQPDQIEQKVTVLKYEHTGKFNYIATQKPSYLFGDISLEDVLKTQETPKAKEPAPVAPLQSNPKYPVEMIDTVDITFIYGIVAEKLARVSEDVEVKVVMQKEGGKAQETIVVPKTQRTGGLTVSFSLRGEDLASSATTTIQAAVYSTIETTDADPVFESFSQSMVIRLKGPHIEVDKNLKSTQRASFGSLVYEHVGVFDYVVKLKDTSPFGAITLEPPTPAPQPEPAPTPEAPLTSDKKLGPEDTIFTKLFESANMTFTYRLISDGTVSQLTEEVKIEAILENPEVWTKTITLVPPTKKNGPFTVSFVLDEATLARFQDVYKAIEKETGASVPPNVALKATVKTIGETPHGIIDQTFTQTLSTSLGGQTIKWNEKLDASQPGKIEKSRLVPNTKGFMGLSLKGSRSFGTVFSGLLLILFVSFVALNARFRPPELSPVEEGLRASKKHKDVIVDVKELPGASFNEAVVMLGSLDDLVKTADSLLKPILHKAEPDKHTYCVIDGTTRYQYVVARPQVSSDSTPRNA